MSESKVSTAASRSCPLCGSSAAWQFNASDRNRGIASGRLDYYRCTGCHSYFLAPVPKDLARFYPGDYHGHPSPEQLDNHARAEQPKLDLLLQAVTGGRLLEIGPGTGTFSRASVLAGFETTVVEMDEDCCSYIESTVGAHAIHSDRPEVALDGLDGFDAIAMWHVIEHLPDPWAVFEAAVSKLQPGGAIIVGTPNPESLQFRVLGPRWAHLDAPRHVFLIPEPALRAKAEQLGLQHVLSTTSDPAGRHWNRFGWEYALRRHPARNPSTALTTALSLLLTIALRPLESRGMAGSTYTALFMRPS